MLCDICLKTEAKYTCPKCSSKYCSLACFKTPAHLEKDGAALKKQAETTSKLVAEDGVKAETVQSHQIEDPMLAMLIKESQFQEYIASPVLQFHILSLLEILNDVGLTNEYSKDGRVEIASRKLNGLREGGIEGNEYVEEFIGWLLKWMDEYKGKCASG